MGKQLKIVQTRTLLWQLSEAGHESNAIFLFRGATCVSKEVYPLSKSITKNKWKSNGR
jgi:hypothetical protein